MNIDPALINKALNAIPYPVGKDHLIQFAKQFGLPENVIGMLDGLPDITFNSAEDVQKALGGLGFLGNLGNLGRFFQ